MSYEIFRLEEKDIAESIKLLQTLGSPISTIVSDSEILKRTLYGPHAVTLIAKENGKVAGVVHGTATMPLNIVLLATKPSANLGSMLVDKFADHARNQFPPANAVRTSLPADMTEIVAFYSSKRFIVEGFIKGGIQNRDFIFLRKPLIRQTTTVT